MADATLSNHYHGNTSGTSTTLAISSVVVAAGERVLVEAIADSVGSDFKLTSAVLGAAGSCIRIRRKFQGMGLRVRELWVFNAPAAGTYTLTITAPSAVKMGAAVYVVANTASLYVPNNVRWSDDTPFGDQPSMTCVVSNPASVTALAIVTVASTINNQTFTVNTGTSKFEDDSVANTNLHLAAASDLVGAGGSQNYDISFGTDTVWTRTALLVVTGTGAAEHGTLQPWFGFSVAQGNIGRLLPVPTGGDGGGSTVSGAHGPVQASGRVRNLYINLSTAPGVGKSRDFVFMVNGSDTSVAVTISGTATSGNTAVGVEAAFSRYDLITLHSRVTGGPATTDVFYWMEAEFDEPYVSVYGNGTVTTVSDTVGVTVYQNPLFPVATNWDASRAGYESRIACDGSITGLAGKYQITMTGSDQYELSLYLNGVKQDGSGGTVDTRTYVNASSDVADSQSIGKGSFNLPVVIGDHVAVGCKATAGNPFGGGGVLGLRMAVMTRFEATADGEFMICYTSSALPGVGATQYDTPQSYQASTWDSTESNRGQKVGLMSSPLHILGATRKLTTAPGGIQSRTMTVRVNGADSDVTIPLTGGSNTGQDSGDAEYATGDTFDLKAVTSAAPAGSAFEYIGLRGWMQSGAAIVQRVTQLVGFVAYDEDAENDDPPAVTDCTGGGAVASSSNPTDGASIATATDLHAWIVITIGATTYYWSDNAINHVNARDPRVAESGWEWSSRALPDERGGYEASAVTITLLDGDNLLRGLHNSQTLRHANAAIFVATEATIRSGGGQLRFSGIVTGFTPVSGAKYELTIEDPISLALSAEAQDTLLPAALIDINDGTSDQRLREAPEPSWYGSLSDEDEDDPKGAVEADFMGTETVPGHEDLGNMHKYLGCRGASHNIQSVFGGDPLSGDPPTRRAKFRASDYGTNLYAPHQAGWFLAEDYSVENGKRYTFIYLDQHHPAAELSRYGIVPITLNVCGREEVGDATGNTVNDAASILLLLLNTEWAQAVGDIDWPALAMRAGFSLFNADSFATVKSRLEGRISGGYLWGFVLGHSHKQTTLREVLQQAYVSGTIEIFASRLGQICATTLDRTSTASGVPHYTAEADILEDSFTIDPKTDAVENAVIYYYKRNYITTLHQPTPQEGARLPQAPFKADWLSDKQEVIDATSITALGGEPKGRRESQPQLMEFVRHTATADDVAAQRLALRKHVNGRAEARFEIPLQRCDTVELGDLVKVTHPQGIGSSGWVAKRCQVRRIREDWARMVAELTVLDVDDLLA